MINKKINLLESLIKRIVKEEKKKIKEGLKSDRKFYLGRRDNPQFKKPYYVAYGQLPKSEVKKKENSLYGSMTLEPYDTEQEYEREISRLESEGFKVNRR